MQVQKIFQMLIFAGKKKFICATLVKTKVKKLQWAFCKILPILNLSKSMQEFSRKNKFLKFLFLKIPVRIAFELKFWSERIIMK